MNKDADPFRRLLNASDAFEYEVGSSGQRCAKKKEWFIGVDGYAVSKDVIGSSLVMAGTASRAEITKNKIFLADIGRENRQRISGQIS